MKITDLLKVDTMIIDLKSVTKEAVIDELAGQLTAAGCLHDEAEFKAAILKREEQSTTGIGEGIAIPHAKTSAVRTPSICFGRSKSGVDYESLDGQSAHLFFMIAASVRGQYGSPRDTFSLIFIINGYYVQITADGGCYQRRNCCHY